MHIKKFLCLTICLFFSMQSLAISFLFHPEIKKYIQTTSGAYDFNEETMTHWFKAVSFDNKVIRKMTAPAESKSWDAYYNIFITPKRLNQASAFLNQNAAFLQKTKKNYGVPPEVILGILGAETGYGRNEGSFSAFRALTTLSFKYPHRANYFQNELTHYLLLCRERHWNLFDIKSSYAGALGMPQFMPSSYRIYAINGDRGSNKDLFHNSHDAIASIANFLNKKGWKANEPVVIRAQVSSNKALKLKNSRGELKFTVKKLQSYGIFPVKKISPSLKAGVIVFKSSKGLEYWITFSNFGILKKYNPSNKYAVAVYEIGRLAVKNNSLLQEKQEEASSPHYCN